MSAQTRIQTAPPCGSASPAPTRAHGLDVSQPVFPAIRAAAPMGVAPQLSVTADRPTRPSGGFIGRLWRAYRTWRADRILRNLADEMDAHMLKDVGAPEWVVSRATLEQSLKRITRIDTLRW